MAEPSYEELKARVAELEKKGGGGRSSGELEFRVGEKGGVSVQSLTAIEKDLDTLNRIIQDPAVDLFAPISWGRGQTVFREVIQIIDHASHDLGQLILMRRLEGDWKKS